MRRLVFFELSIVWSFDIRIISPRHATSVNSSPCTLGAVVNTNSMQISGHSLKRQPDSAYSQYSHLHQQDLTRAKGIRRSIRLSDGF